MSVLTHDSGRQRQIPNQTIPELRAEFRDGFGWQMAFAFE